MTDRGLPPGPKGLSALAFLQAGLSPHPAVLKRIAAKYGDTFRVSYPTGAVTFTGDPEALRAIYSADPATLDVWGREVIAPVFGTSSVVVTTSAHHRRDRKLLTPAFSGNPMRAAADTIVEAAHEAAASWAPGRTFVMLETTQTITLDIMVRVVFGVEGRPRIRSTTDAVLELIDSLHPLIFLFPFLRRELGGVGPWARYRRAVTALDALLSEEICARRASGAERNDILSLILSARYDDGSVMEDAEVLDHLRGLLFAGHEATSAALAWIFYALHREPALLEHVMSEIDALGPSPQADTFASLRFLDAVCQEALRLFPPVVDAARITLAPLDLGRYTVPAGEAIRPSICLLHARPELFPDPEQFRPERFLERKYSPFEFAPFGGGARRCLGAAFSMYEMKLVLGTLLREHRLALLSTEAVAQVRRGGLTMGPKGGIPMVLLGRRSPPSWKPSPLATVTDAGVHIGAPDACGPPAA